MGGVGNAARKGRERGRLKIVRRAFPYFLSYCMGVLLPPRLAHSAPVEVGGSGLFDEFLCVCVALVYIP